MLRILLAVLVLGTFCAPAYANTRDTITWNMPDPGGDAIKEKMDSLNKNAADGDADAEFELGNMYYGGAPDMKVEQNLGRALMLFQQAARQGHVKAEFWTGYMYEFGQGVPSPNYSEASTWLKKAADQGDARAQYEYASLLLRGLGMPVDQTEAYYWLLLSAKGKNPDALKILEKVQSAIPPEDAQAMADLAREWKPGSATTEEKK